MEIFKYKFGLFVPLDLVFDSSMQFFEMICKFAAMSISTIMDKIVQLKFAIIYN